jgi:hypothetical protein
VNREKYFTQAAQQGHKGAIWELADLRSGQGRFEEAIKFAREYEVTAGLNNGIAVALRSFATDHSVI